MAQDNGMALLGAPLPAEGAETVYAAVSAKADRDKVPDDSRTKAQRRADALIGICSDYLNAGVTTDNDTTGSGSGSVPRWHGLRPAVNVSVALSTLLGLDDQPADLDGHGPIPAAVARRIAADESGTWRRLVTDPTGRLLDYGRSTYRPPTDLAQHVIARDRTFPRRLRLHRRGDPHCAPGCSQPARRCDLHHLTPFSRGGPTNPDNLICVCEHDHYSIHDAGWQLTRLDDGTVEWTSPIGHVYRVHPATYPIDTTRPARTSEDRTDHATEQTSHSTPDAWGEDQTDHATDRIDQSDRPDQAAQHSRREDQSNHSSPGSGEPGEPPF